MIKMFFASLILMSSFAQAGVCKLTITRKSCGPAADKEAYGLYENKGDNDAGGIKKSNPTHEDKPAADFEECRKKAEEASVIKRMVVLAEKSVEFKFGDKTETIKKTSSCK